MIRKIKSIISTYNLGKKYDLNELYKHTKELNKKEVESQVKRFHVLNFLLSKFENPKYLEIGVRNPEDNFNKIECSYKVSVDPGLEYEKNPVDYKMTSDDFFQSLKLGKILDRSLKFDVIFIDGLHLANQVEKDIENALEVLSEMGFIVLHDCNPPTEYHARENYKDHLTPAKDYWNGTVWKTFYKYRCLNTLTSCCINTDFGIGILTRNNFFNNLIENENKFFEFNVFNQSRKVHLNLISYLEFKTILNSIISEKYK